MSVKYSGISKIRDTFGLSLLLLGIMFATSGCQRLMAAIEEEVEQYVAGDNQMQGNLWLSQARFQRLPASANCGCKRYAKFCSTQSRTT